MSTATASTFDKVLKKASELIREDTEASLLASILLSISSLELVLITMINLELKITLLNIGIESLNKVNNKKPLRGYDLDNIVNLISLRKGATLGEMIVHIKKYLIFPEKKEFLELLTTINDSRNKVVHDIIKIYEKNRSPQLYIRKIAQKIAINTSKAIDLTFDISERSSSINLSDDLLK